MQRGVRPQIFAYCIMSVSLTVLGDNLPPSHSNSVMKHNYFETSRSVWTLEMHSSKKRGARPEPPSLRILAAHVDLSRRLFAGLSTCPWILHLDRNVCHRLARYEMLDPSSPMAQAVAMRCQGAPMGMSAFMSKTMLSGQCRGCRW